MSVGGDQRADHARNQKKAMPEHFGNRAGGGRVNSSCKNQRTPERTPSRPDCGGKHCSG